MKKIVFVVYSLFLFCCCSEKDEIVQNVVEPEIKFYSGFVGEKYVMIFDMDARDYTIRNNNPEILSWKYSERKSNVIDIHTLSDGYGSIDVLDVDNNVKSVFCVQSYSFGGNNIEELSMHPTEKIEVVVNAGNADVKQLIEKELWEKVDRIYRTRYTFNSETNEFTMDVPRLEQKLQGTYEWNIDSLILKYNDVTERYGFGVATGRVCYLIREDKTKEYQLLYPDAGITLVKVKRIWYDWNTFHV